MASLNFSSPQRNLTQQSWNKETILDTPMQARIYM